MTDASDTKGKGATPPYIAWQSLKTLLGDFKEHGVPGRVDRTVLTRFSGGVGSQILAGMRFLGLIDSENHPTGALRELAQSYQTDDWQFALTTLLQAKYAPLFELDLQSATPGQFIDAFKRAYPGKDDTQRKSITFFLNAAREAGIPFSSYLSKGAKPRTAPPRPRQSNGSKKAVMPAKKDDQLEKPDTGSNFGAGSKPPAPDVMLLSLLDPASMSPEEQQAVWTLLLYLKKPKTQGGGNP